MSGFQFPPPASESGDGWEDVDYPTADRGGRFILPPPRRTPGGDVDEVAQRIAGEISWIRETAVHADEEVRNLGTVVADYGDALERKVEPWAVPTVAPLSQTINRRADPVFGLSDFMIPPVHGEDAASGLQSGGDTKGRVYMVFITPALNRAYEQLNFFVSEVTDPCRMDVAVYVLDPDTRMWRRQVLQTNVSITLGESVATVEFDTPWIATQGSYVAVAWLQHGTGNTRYLLGLNDTPRPLGDQVYPHKISAIHTSTGMSGLPATINGATQTDFSFWFTPYAELSENIGMILRNFTENWPDVGEAQRPWVALTAQGINSSGGYTAAGGVGMRLSMYDTPLATDYVRVRTSVYRMFNNGQYSALVIRGTNDMRSGVGLRVSNLGEYTVLRWQDTHAFTEGDTLATLPVSPQEGDQIEIDYLDGLVTVRINGAERVTGLAVGGPQGSAGRFVGIRSRRDSTGGLFPSFSPSPWFGPWSARDLPQSNGDDDGDGEEGD